MTNTNQTAALIAEEAYSAGNLVTNDGYYEFDLDAAAAIIAKHLPAPVSDGLVGRLREIRDDMARHASPPLADPFSVVEVRALGERIGYGNLMSSASALWRENLADLAGGEFVCGPCRKTAERYVVNLDEAVTHIAQLEARIEKLTGALTRGNQFAVTFIAFHNRDRNTERMGETLDGLLAEALVVDSLARAALNEKD